MALNTERYICVSRRVTILLNNFVRHFILYISVLLLVSCSTRKDRFLNRNYHALVAKYNVLYNGEVAYQKGVEEVEKTYYDDFTSILPIEPFSFFAEEKMDDRKGPIGQENFERAEEKAVKSIQKHTMLIHGEERNPQIDEAYLLLGKSRYYTKRFAPALEAFEYIVKNYPRASSIYETVLWRAKANIHNGNVDFGRRALKRLLTSSNVIGETRQQAEFGLVMTYEKTPDSIDLSIEHLEASLDAVEKGVMASRAAFVLGQLYRKKGMIAESDASFDRVIATKKGLYKYKLQAKLEKINNHLEDYSSQEFLDEVDHLIFIRKNRLYVNKLLYQKGLIYDQQDSIALAKYFYTKSIEKSEKDIDQKTRAYEKIGDVFYREKDYKNAKTYYDSLIDVSQNKNSSRAIRIKRKSNSLKKIVETIDMSITNDSILKVASLNEDGLNVYFQEHIDHIKLEEKRQREKELRVLALQSKLSIGDDSQRWYFYNAEIKEKGREAFRELWNFPIRNKGWYASSLRTATVFEEAKKGVEKDTVQKKNISASKYDIAFYTQNINRDPKFLDSVFITRNLNYYELGNAYYNQLGEKDLAVKKLKELVSFKPSDDLKVGAYYRLYKIYKDTEDSINSDVYKQKLQQEFPKSSFTQLVNNTQNEGLGNEEENAPIVCYETIYDLYLLNSFEAALEEITEAKMKYAGVFLSPKYALLNAYIKAKLRGKDEFHKLLKELKLRYPNAIEAQKAEELLRNN